MDVIPPHVAEYVELSEQIATIAALTESEERLCARLDQLWYFEMSEDDRAEAQLRLAMKAAQHREAQPLESL